MITDKDKQDIEKAKQLIAEQIAETKKLDLGLDADGSSKSTHQPESKFDGFRDKGNLPGLEEK